MFAWFDASKTRDRLCRRRESRHRAEADDIAFLQEFGVDFFLVPLRGHPARVSSR